MISKYKNIIIIGVVIALGLIAYSIFKPAPTAETLLETTQRADSAQVLGDEITSAISQINSLKLDRGVLDDPVVKNLKDHSKPIIPEDVGRKNPFAPIGEVGSSASNVNSTTLKINTASSTTATSTKTTTSTSTTIQ
jgi:hypothetical protein